MKAILAALVSNPRRGIVHKGTHVKSLLYRDKVDLNNFEMFLSLRHSVLLLAVSLCICQPTLL